MPKISIITVNLNNAKGLEKTIESVISQTFNDYEYIIIDGGSTDESVEIIKKYAEKITYWVSEPDKGIYNGMNKGIDQATGEYLLFLNSGDYLADTNVFEKFIGFNTVEDIVYGYIYTKKDSQKKEIRHFPSRINLSFFLLDSLPHPATFIKRNVFKKNGKYNENYEIISDWIFFLNIYINGDVKFKKIELAVSVYILGGLSDNKKNKKVIENEKKYVLNRLFPFYVVDVFNEFMSLHNKYLGLKSSKSVIYVLNISSIIKRILGLK